MNPAHDDAARILLVEDDRAQARLLGAWLRRRGHEIVVCGDGEAAIGELEGARFDLVISDVQLPKVSGVVVLRHRNDRWPDTPVMLLTAHDSGRLASRAIDHGVDTFLVKPVGRAALLERVDRLLDKARRAGSRRVAGTSGGVEAEVQVLRPAS